jgi:hypothetical protein
MRVPFNLYDFLGYLASGFLVLASLDFSCGSVWLRREMVPPLYALFWLLCAYILGHLVAHSASFLIENLFLRTFLGSPEIHLFGTPSRSWKARLFPNHFRPLPGATQERVLARAQERGAAGSGRALFLHCLAIVQIQPVTMDRLNIFLAQYGFCRNVSLASLLASCALVFSRVSCPSMAPRLLPWLPAALLVAIGMLYRYLKFFRHYTAEVFTAYAEVAPLKSTSRE